MHRHQKYFTEGAQRAAPFENLITVGMRGSGDLPLEPGTNIELLEDIIKTQRQILSNVFNTSDASTIPQVWCLYKEVLNYYNLGLRVPDDVTLLWTGEQTSITASVLVYISRQTTTGNTSSAFLPLMNGRAPAALVSTTTWTVRSLLFRLYPVLNRLADVGVRTYWHVN